MSTLGKGYQEPNTRNNVGWLVAKLLDQNLHCAHVMRELVRRHSPARKLKDTPEGNTINNLNSSKELTVTLHIGAEQNPGAQDPLTLAYGCL
jgi:hypothetical protein